MIIKVCEARQSATVSASSAGGSGAGGGLPPRRASDSNLGRSMGGLVRYLVGPGKENEHTDPTLVAASEPLDLEYGEVDFTSEWAAADTTALVAQLNKPMRDRRDRDELPPDRGFVFHAVMSLPPGETADTKLWGRMAKDYITLMGFDEAENKAPCRWAAFHHGRSVEGNDHIHVAVMMIRDDGTWASNGNSKRRSMTARKEITAKYGLVPAEEVARRRDRVPYATDDVHSRRVIHPSGQVQVEHRREPRHSENRAATGPDSGVGQQRGSREPDNDKLRRLMTSAAGQAETEADYIKALWRAGVLTRPRYADGTTDVVTGYSVALRRNTTTSSTAGSSGTGGADRTGGPVERSQWRGAGSVHKSLRLSALRQRWSDDPEAATTAAATWRTYRGEDVPTPQPHPGRQQAAADAATQVSALNVELQDLDRRDARAWSGISREVAAILAEGSLRHESDRPGPLAEASEALLRDAENHPAMRTPVATPKHSGLARSVRLLAQASSRHDTLGWVAVLEQLVHTVGAIAEARRAQDRADEAAYLLARTEHGLQHVRHQLIAVAPSAADTALNTGPGARSPGPGPRPLEPGQQLGPQLGRAPRPGAAGRPGEQGPGQQQER